MRGCFVPSRVCFVPRRTCFVPCRLNPRPGTQQRDQRDAPSLPKRNGVSIPLGSSGTTSAVKNSHWRSPSPVDSFHPYGMAFFCAHCRGELEPHSVVVVVFRIWDRRLVLIHPPCETLWRNVEAIHRAARGGA